LFSYVGGSLLNTFLILSKYNSLNTADSVRNLNNASLSGGYLADNKPLSNFLLPKHELVSAGERADILKKFSISSESIPKIPSTDPGLIGLTLKVGDIVKITRNDVNVKNEYYRIVIE